MVVPLYTMKMAPLNKSDIMIARDVHTWITDYTDHGSPGTHTNPHDHYWTRDENGNPTRT